ncbi:DUF302 domain-containing protein [Xanthobacter flavus]|uniref:DUF302 domain-containing protein n=1 Tax=Xanthobacter TaxID=279 RepID=UPI000BDA1959|nr:MAG: hypothetical protein B7X76_00240 [Azorhizobium sp. 39-67-5]
MMANRLLLTCIAITLLALPAGAGGLEIRPGWKVFDTTMTFQVLSESLEAAVKSNKMGIVTTASASDGAKAQGITIPGNRVVGVYRNDFARRMLAASLPAGIEAPIRFYIVENPDSTASLAYKTPSTVFEPYLTGAGGDLKALASELDTIFAKIAADTIATR